VSRTAPGGACGPARSRTGVTPHRAVDVPRPVRPRYGEQEAVGAPTGQPGADLTGA